MTPRCEDAHARSIISDRYSRISLVLRPHTSVKTDYPMART